ncbi:hypothetical protein [Vibrio alginolyticus]|nr:hypothetical protein [Vibrio alginolyticus]
MTTQADAWSTALLWLGFEQGILVVNDNHLIALFIDEADGELKEQRSKA